MASEQFCLKWNNFQTSILTAFESLQATEDLADVTLACEGACIRAHKFILSACSPYFRMVFKDNPCSHPIVILKDIAYRDVIGLLDFMYHGEVLVAKDQLKSFLNTAEALQVSGLKGLPDSTQKKKLKRNNVDDIETNAKKNRLNKLKTDEALEKCKDFEIVTVDNIKVEIEDSKITGLKDNERIGSLLETALEIKDSPSILERSLTSQAIVKSPNTIQNQPSEIVKQTHIPRKPPDENEDKNCDLIKMESDSDFSNSNEGVTDNSSQILKLDMQPHHSSQCGNCPHCGKIYSNQSALKYHVRLVHSDLLNLYCCHLCPLTFGFRDSYKKHMIDAHSVRS